MKLDCVNKLNNISGHTFRFLKYFDTSLSKQKFQGRERKISSYKPAFKTLGISDDIRSHPFLKEVNDPTMRAIMKYRNHASVLTILGKYNNNSYLHFLMLLKKRF